MTPRYREDRSTHRSFAPGADFSHGGAGPWNVVARDNRPFALIDWEMTGRVDRLNELARTACFCA